MKSGKKPDVHIIGAGISGLSAGIYLQKSGFNTEIFEKHDIPGGLCTSWDIGGYTFDGCLQWLLGSAPGSSFYKMWREIIDIDNIAFINHEYRIRLEVRKNSNKYGNKFFYFYNNLNKLQDYLIDLGPEDKPLILEWIKDIRYLQRFDLPPVLKDEGIIKNSITRIKMTRYIGLFLKYLKYKNQTNKSFSQKFKTPFLQEVFDQLYDQFEVNMLVIMFPMASYDLESAGYPVGGSLALARKFEAAYLEAGGKIHYKTPVLKINTHGNTAESLTVRNQIIHQADYIISAADWKFTICDLLGGKYDKNAQQRLLYDRIFKPYYSSLQCSFGLNADLSDYDHFTRFPLNQSIFSPDGMEYDRFEIHIFNYDPTMSPKGKTCVIVNFYTENSEFWIQLRAKERARYRQEKAVFIDRVKNILTEKINGFNDHLEVEDMSTPATYLRYTNNWLGSTQGWLPGKNMLQSLPIKLKVPGLKNMFVASHWNQPGGGLPIAVTVARQVTQDLCKMEKMTFLSKEK